LIEISSECKKNFFFEEEILYLCSGDLAIACEKIEALKSVIESNTKYLKTIPKTAIKIGLNQVMSKPS